MLYRFYAIALLSFSLPFIATPSIANSDTSLTTPPASGRNAHNTQEMLPADVLARVKLLSAELELIRKAIGKPTTLPMPVTVSNASPREVYFAAKSLYQKANRLSYEITGTDKSERPTTNQSITPSHVWWIVNDALQRILTVKKHLGIHKKIHEQSQPESTTATAVLNAIIKNNQQLNSLLYKQVMPADVYEKLTLAIHYTERLLKQFNSEQRIPKPNPLQKNLTPEDVFKSLVKCISTLKQIANASKIKMLDLNTSHHYQAKPSNVYDLAKIIVAEVRYLNLSVGNKSSIESYNPGYKTPSEVYQRASILQKQLDLLKKYVTQQPNWVEAAKARSH